MFSRPTHLAIRSTSPTVLFTVSNAPVRSSSLSSNLNYCAGLATRASIGILVLLLDFVKAQGFKLSRYDSALWQDFETSFVGGLFCSIAGKVDWKILVAGSVALLYLISRRGYTGLCTFRGFESTLMLTYRTEESLLVLRGLGIQTSTSSPTYLSTATTRFIPTTQIQDVVIHEAFKGFEVRYYLAVIVDGESGLVVVFPVGILPHPG